MIRDEHGVEIGRIVDDRDPNLMSDDEYDDMLAAEEREQWEAERTFAEPMVARGFCQGPLCGPQLEVVEVLEYVTKTVEEPRHYVRLRAGGRVRWRLTSEVTIVPSPGCGVAGLGIPKEAS